MEILGLKIEKLNHASFKIKKDKTIYIDPFKISEDEKADLILISHEHFDHCSPEDIEKVIGNNTTIIVNSNALSKVSKLPVKNIIVANPGKEIEVNEIKVKAVPAYNTNKYRSPGVHFHPKQDEHVGFIIEINGIKVYHSGDTDVIPEMDMIHCDIALLPVSGTYVMTAEEAVEAVGKIKPKVVVPMHYGDIVGTAEDAERFKSLVKGVEVVIL